MRRPLRSATMLAVRHWLGFGSRNTAEGADKATSGGALTALADAASGGACFCAACARPATEQGFTLSPPSLPARALRDGSTRSAAEIAVEEEGEQRAHPLPSGGAVHTEAHCTRPTLLEGTAIARARQNLEPEEGGDVVLLLTPAQLMQKRDRLFRLPAGCPEGPWPSDAAALAAINRWASDHTKVGGSWGVTWANGVNAGNSKRGPQHSLCCALRKKHQCGWSMRLEETTDGWMIYTFSEHKSAEGRPLAKENGHSHDLTVTLGQRLSQAAQREIPGELHEIAKLMRKSGSAIKDVENFLRVKVTNSGDTAAFTYDDVRHLVGATTAQRAWDATDFIEQLEERRKLRGLFYKFSLDSDGRLENAFFVMDGAMEIYAAGGRCNVLVFDTKHGTNTHKLKLGCFTTVAPSGATKVLAASLVASESEKSFAWVFECLLEAFRIPPAVIFTDSDPGMAAAIAHILITTLHFLCTWHLSKNLLAHVKPALFPSSAGCDAFMSDWWAICMRSDTSCIGSFDNEWAALLAPIRNGPPSDERTAALDWLESLYQRRKQWAARFTWGTLTLAIHSSQRGEAVHSALDRFCSASMLLTNLLERLDAYGENVDVRAETRDTLRCLRLLQREQMQSVPPIISSFARIVTPYAVTLLQAQWLQSLHYTVELQQNDVYLVKRISSAVSDAAAPASISVQEQAADAGDGVGGTPAFSAARITSLALCSCQFPSSTGLACRHQLAIAAHLQMHDASRLVIAQHWRLLDDEQRASLLRQLFAAPPVTVSAGPPSRHGMMLKSDRFALVMSEFRGIAGAASEAPEATEWLLSELQRVSRALRNAASVSTADATGGAAAGRGKGRGTERARGAIAAAAVEAAKQAAGAAQLAAVARTQHTVADMLAVGPSEATRGDLAGGAAGGKVVGVKQKRACGVCGLLGHRADNRKYHPKDAAPAHAPSPLPLPPLPQAPPLRVTEFAPPPQPSPSPPDAALPSRSHVRAAAGGRTEAVLHTGGIVVTLGATALTTLLGPGGQFGLDDVVRAGGVAAAAPPAAAATPASDSDDVPLGQRGERFQSLRALPPCEPLVLVPTGSGKKRKREDISRAPRPGGGEAPPVSAPANVPSRGRPRQARFKSHWERRSSQ